MSSKRSSLNGGNVKAAGTDGDGVDRLGAGGAVGEDGPDVVGSVGVGGEETGLERRRGPGRRRTAFTKAAEEGEMTGEQFMFVRAIEAFKQANNKTFPSWTDVLEVVRLLGYRKTMACELNLRGVEDWQEKADAAAGVRKGQHETDEEQRQAA